MSRRDEDPDQAVRELLQKYEQEEAAVLRAELIAFLKSPECRTELEKIVQKPLEMVVLSALTNTKFQEQLRDAVIASLKPEIIKAAESAAAGALNDIKVTISGEAQKQIRLEAEEAFRNAFATAQKDALASLKPEIVKAAESAAAGALNHIMVTISEAQKQMRLEAEETLRSAFTTAQVDAFGFVPKLANEAGRQRQPQSDDFTAPPPPQRRGPRLSRDKLRWALVTVGILVIFGVSHKFAGRRDEPRDAAFINDGAPLTEAPPPPAEAVDTAPRPSALFEQYRVAVSLSGRPNLTAPSGAEMKCVESAIEKAETGKRLDVAALRGSLNNCAAMSVRPTATSPIIASVQAELTLQARARSCGALLPVTIDGRHGTQTSRALKTYIDCTDLDGVPAALETLGDYAAVGVYFVDKRMHDAGTVTRR